MGRNTGYKNPVIWSCPCYIPAVQHPDPNDDITTSQGSTWCRGLAAKGHTELGPLLLSATTKSLQSTKDNCRLHKMSLGYVEVVQTGLTVPTKAGPLRGNYIPIDFLWGTLKHAPTRSADLLLIIQTSDKHHSRLVSCIPVYNWVYASEVVGRRPSIKNM